MKAAHQISTNPLPFIPIANQPTYSCNATYYGADIINGIHGGNDNIFEHIPSSQYTAPQLLQVGSYYCAMDSKFLKMGYMGKVIRVTGKGGTLNMVVVDTLPDRDSNVHIDVVGILPWIALAGSDPSVGMQPVTFKLIGTAAIPISPYSPYAPQNLKYL